MHWTDVTFSGVYWNDPKRVAKLLRLVRPWFTHVIVGVQADEPATDPTYLAATKWADEVITDRVAGHCEPTIGKVLNRIPTDWTFLVSADETPSKPLLGAFQDILDDAAAEQHDGYWIRMLSSIQGVPYPSEQDNHLRVFKTKLGWPPTLHSRPPAFRAKFWRPEDILHHDRSLDEMMEDYLRYWEIGQGNAGWVAHNRQMMHDACEATARHHGWAFVSDFPWWPRVRQIAFNGEDPAA